MFDSRDAVYIVLELMQGGELFDRITKQGHLSEQFTRFLFRQMVLAVKYLHSQGITHRDLKVCVTKSIFISCFSYFGYFILSLDFKTIASKLFKNKFAISQPFIE